MAKAPSFISRGRKISTINRCLLELQRDGILHNQAGSGDGAEWLVDGASLKNFGSCSYLGLERHALLEEGAHAAVTEFGTQFSISRAYLQSPLYVTLEDALAEITGRPVVTAPSTTLGHLAALPVLVGDDDAVLIDQFAHASLHMATDLIDDVSIERIRHNRLDQLEEKVASLSQTAERVWYVCDGLYSMLGDFAPFEGLRQLLARYPKLHLYIDDAHSMSWTGRFGRGAALMALGDSERVVVALSMAKAFGSSGGILAVPTEEMRERIRRCGGPMIFSGPLPPAVLGAAAASAKLHLSAEFSALQDELRERIDHARTIVDRCGLRTATEDRSPIVMVQYDASQVVTKIVSTLRARGFYTCPAVFPAVPMNKPSIRFTISRHNSFEDIEEFIETLASVSASVEDSTAEPFAADTGVRSVSTLRKIPEVG